LTHFKSTEGALDEAVTGYFTKYDADGNGHIDRKELRSFLCAFFEEFSIKLPITDEFVDATFRELDQDKSNSIELEEIKVYSQHFMVTMGKLFGLE
jgi:Ca2+-binding EF-hand superfamily protein